MRFSGGAVLSVALITGADEAPGQLLIAQQSMAADVRLWLVLAAIVIGVQLALLIGLLAHRARRRRTEELMRASEERYRSVVETQSEMICRFLPDTTLTFVNDAFCQFWNRSTDDLLGRRFVELVPVSSRDAVSYRLRQLKSGTDTHEHPVLLGDGAVGWHQWTNRAIVDEEGRLIEVQGVGRDITERKRVEEALLELKARTNAAIRAVPDFVFVIGRNGTYLDYLGHKDDQLYARPDHFLGKTIREVLPPEPAALLTEAVESAFRTPDPVVVEFELPLGEDRWFEAQVVCIDKDRVLSTVRDITVAKRAMQDPDLAKRLTDNEEVERTRIARDLNDGVFQQVATVRTQPSAPHADRQPLEAQVPDNLAVARRHTAQLSDQMRILLRGAPFNAVYQQGLVRALRSYCATVERRHKLHIVFLAEGEIEPTSTPVALSLFGIAREALRNTVRQGRARGAVVSVNRFGGHLSLTVTDDDAGFDAVPPELHGRAPGSIEERARLVHGQAWLRSVKGQGTSIEVQVPV